jgi:protein-disulfide isomerase
VSRQKIVLALSALVLIAVAVAAWYVLRPGEDASAAAAGPGYVLTAHDRALGDPKAKVVLIEYAAPSCPVCARFNSDTFPRLKKDYIDTGKVYYVFRLFPLRPDDGAAEKIARCLPEDKYFDFIDLLFRNQPKWDVEFGVQDVHAGLVLVSRMAGISEAQVDKCMADTKEDTIINQVAEDGQTKYGITGTPTIIVDGVSAGSRFFSYDEVKALIDTALAGKK